MTPKRVTLIALLLGQTVLAGAAWSQQATTETVDLDTITLRARGTDTGTGPVTGANPATEAGTKSATPVTEVPQSVSVIGAEQLRVLNTGKLDAALSYSAGVEGQPYGSDTDTNWVFIRGFNATQTGLYQDGLPNYAYGFGGFFIDPFLVERIEVLKGASSVLYGGSNPGGLVNATSKAPTGKDTTELEAGVGSEGRGWLSFDKNGRISANTDYRVLGKLERVDGNGAFSAGVRGVLSGSVLQRLDNGAELTLGLDLIKVDEDHSGNAWLPYVGTVVDAPFGRIPLDFNVGEPDHDSYKRDQVAARMVYRQQIGGWDLTNTARLAWSKVEEESVLAYGYAGGVPDDVGTLTRGVFDHRTSARTLLNDTRLERTVQTGSIEHRLLLGLDLKYFSMDVLEKSGFPAPGLPVVDPIRGLPLPDAVAYKDIELTQKQAGLYFQDQMRWGNGWIGTTNLRYDWVETEASRDAATGAAGSSRRDGELTWRLGLAKTMANNLTAYVSASTYFNPVVEPSSAGNDLKPESGQQIEAGLKWAPTDDFLLTGAIFDLTRENVTQSVWSGGGYVFSQTGKIRSRGVEIEAQGKINDELTIAAAVTDMQVEVRDDVNAAIIGNTPYAVAERIASLRLSWTPAGAPNLTLTGAARYTGPSWADEANTLRVGGRTLYDLGINYRMDNGWSGNLAITNLADKTYVSSCAGANYCYYGEGRAVSLSLRKTF